MKVSRRTFLKLAGATGASGLLSRPQTASATTPHPDATATLAILVDTTRCVGCRGCEAACSESNRLPPPAMAGEDAVFEEERPTSPEAYTVVNRFHGAEDGGAPTFVKKQCMHCLQPACASACLVGALEKTPDGPVVYHEDRCIGCRYCMVACPFGIPQFEYSKALPYVRKCTFCRDRLAEGKEPACTSVCPSGALQFGTRKDLLEIARTRIYQNPDRYVHRIYGEREAGGTGVLYISGVPFERLGFRTDVGTTPYSQLTWPFLTAVPFVLTLWPPFLIGIYAFTRSRTRAAEAEAGTNEENRHE
ncbi:MAG: 4Fe-4S ferredoxin [Candidatus Rokubacteria bacterium GWC2_70_16]|nr:MAG: 4Fe-4S ferredoxin [Candidatus Rokubacteria bacterium GWC2_70_16]OGL18339.1 MAG: 4Fe-4S ferredoxin [Candidatus Rokubacteria bacterium RIFCSPLOWO2_12_FULL_71_19]